jgi:hypothetical protein
MSERYTAERYTAERYTAERNGMRLSWNRHMKNGQAFLWAAGTAVFTGTSNYDVVCQETEYSATSQPRESVFAAAP